MSRNESSPIRLPLAALAVALSLAACGQKPGDQAQAPAAEEAPAAAPAPAPAPAPATLVDFSTFDGNTLPTETTNKECALDTVNGQPPAGTPALEPGSSAAVGGWAGNGAGQVATGFHLVLKGTQSYSAPINIGIARPDVAASLNSPGLENSGFTLDFSLMNVATGNYAAYVADPAYRKCVL